MVPPSIPHPTKRRQRLAVCQAGERVRGGLSTSNKCTIHLKDVLLAFFYFVLQFLQLFGVEGWIRFAIGFSRYCQLLLFARCVVGFLGCFYLRGE